MSVKLGKFCDVVHGKSDEESSGAFVKLGGRHLEQSAVRDLLSILPVMAERMGEN